MNIEEERIRYAIEHTEVLRHSKQSLETFGATSIWYYLVTEPAYRELVEAEETVLREGKMTVERPKIVTPYYMTNLFQGFEHGREYARLLIEKYGPDEPGLLYSYKNEPGETSIIPDPMDTVVARLNEVMDRAGNPLAVIIKGVDEMWDVSLMKFIHDMTSGSVSSNVMDLGTRGLLEIDRWGIPRHARDTIDELFSGAEAGQLDPSELKVELDRWGLFPEYEDRFFHLFEKK